MEKLYSASLATISPWLFWNFVLSMLICTSRLQKGNFSCWLVYWYGSISWGERAVIARGNKIALSIPLISLLWSNCTETRVLQTSHQTLSSFLQGLSSLPDKPWGKNFCLSRLVFPHLSLPWEMFQRKIWCGIPRVTLDRAGALSCRTWILGGCSPQPLSGMN